MKIAEEKLNLSITFDEYESRLIRQAARIVFAMHNEMRPKTQSADFRRLIRWAVLAFCRAVIQDGRITFPIAADLRLENPIEQQDRIAGKIPETGMHGTPGGDRNRWN